MSLPVDPGARYKLFGQLDEKRGINEEDCAIIDILAKLRNCTAPIENSIKELKFQVQCLEVISTLPRLAELQQMAHLQQKAAKVYIQFSSRIHAMHESIQNNYNEKDRKSLRATFSTLEQWLQDDAALVRDKVNRYVQEKSKERLLELSTVILGNNEEKLKRLSSQSISYPGIEDLRILPLLSVEQYSTLKKKLELTKILIEEELDEERVREVFLLCHQSIVENSYAVLPDNTFQAELVQFFNSSCNFLHVRLGVIKYLSAATKDEMFLIEMSLARSTLHSLVQLTPLLGVMYTLDIQRSALEAQMSPSTSPHGFVQMTETVFKEAYWPLQWIGYHLNEAINLSEEEQEQVLACIDDEKLRDLVKIAFSNLGLALSI